MKLIDNVSELLKDDLKIEIQKNSRISIASAYFSIYAFQELKDQLKDIDELRFIFTSPTFVKQNELAQKSEKREFYIPRISREKSLYGTEFEVKLRNELTQKAIAKECAEWIKKKVIFKSNITNENMAGFINVDETSYYPVNGFTTVDLGCDRGNNTYNFVNKMDAPISKNYLDLFESLWNDNKKLEVVTGQVIESISSVYKENSPDFIYFVALYNIFNEFLNDISEDFLPNEATGFKESKIWNMLFNFQKDAVLAIINKLEKYNGCILADSVGLGKTFTALGVIKYYENRNKSVLVLCPKKLANNWNTYNGNYKNNPIAKDRLRYDVLYHTDLSRNSGSSNGKDLRVFNWSNYDMVVIDESHNFRNGGKITEDENNNNRYTQLLNEVIKKGVKTKVLMLSATPVNNRFNDLKNQLQLAYEGDPGLINDKLNTKRTIDDIFKNAQKAFNTWSKWSPGERTTENLLKMLDFDFFEVLDSVTIARSRKHIQNYYNTADIGKFPTRLKPQSIMPKLTDIEDIVTYNEIFEELMNLNLSIYTPSKYIHESHREKYAELYEDNKINIGFTQENREQGIRRLMAINLMKRMESSVYSFRLTIERIRELICSKLDEIERVTNQIKDSAIRLDGNSLFVEEPDIFDVDEDDESISNMYISKKKVKISIKDMDYLSWKSDLNKDRRILDLIYIAVCDITPKNDCKLQELFKVLKNKIENPINEGNKKVIIFTAFADTANYLYKNVSNYIKEYFDLDTAVITGSTEGKTTIPKFKANFNDVLTCFSPKSKDKNVLMPNNEDEIDILIATDCISEGQNLQDCDYMINYDIHWNPVRIIQRFGRIDRIGSSNECIQLVNFWPDITLDEYINLKSRVETRMKIVNMTSTGTSEDNLLSVEEKADLEYRKQQLERLQEEVVDIEDMSTGISIMDLGLNEFRLDLLEYTKANASLDKTPNGLHTVVPSSEYNPPGVIYVLRNRDNGVNIDSRNRLHPFYMVYISDEGEVIINYLSPKDLLDRFRYICKGRSEPIAELCNEFNKETNDGRKMDKYSKLLGEAINSIITTNEKNDIDSFLGGEKVSFLDNSIKGIDDFELICFLIIK